MEQLDVGDRVGVDLHAAFTAPRRERTQLTPVRVLGDECERSLACGRPLKCAT